MAYQQLRNGMQLILTAPLSEINASENRLIFLISVSAAIAAGLSALLSLFIVRGVVKPLEELNQVAGKIARGCLDLTVSCKSKDEIGTLADSLRLTVERLKQYIEYITEISGVLEEIASGNPVFELHHEYEGEFSIIKKALINISFSLNQTLLEISRASEQVTNGSEQVSLGAQSLSQGATEQAAAVQELLATVNEIADKVKLGAESAEKAYSLSLEAGSGVKDCSRNMAEMGLAIQNIADASEKINQIVKTVEDIAAQTNILALNAAVESARAGEAGKGFAVVAAEVRSLATQVNEATKNIAQLVADAASAIRTGTMIAGKTEKSLQTVVEKTMIIETKIQEIAEAGKWEAASIEQVNLGIEQISAVVQTNSVTAQEGAAASGEMSGQAQLLRNLIRKFKLESRDKG